LNISDRMPVTNTCQKLLHNLCLVARRCFTPVDQDRASYCETLAQGNC